MKVMSNKKYDRHIVAAYNFGSAVGAVSAAAVGLGLWAAYRAAKETHNENKVRRDRYEALLRASEAPKEAAA